MTALTVAAVAPFKETRAEAYRAGRRVGRDILARHGAGVLAQVVLAGDHDEDADRLTPMARSHHWGVRSILREEA